MPENELVSFSFPESTLAGLQVPWRGGAIQQAPGHLLIGTSVQLHRFSVLLDSLSWWLLSFQG